MEQGWRRLTWITNDEMEKIEAKPLKIHKP